MWENLHHVDWAQLTHAYGRARDVPRTLRNMVSPVGATWMTISARAEPMAKYANSKMQPSDNALCMANTSIL